MWLSAHVASLDMSRDAASLWWPIEPCQPQPQGSQAPQVASTHAAVPSSVQYHAKRTTAGQRTATVDIQCPNDSKRTKSRKQQYKCNEPDCTTTCTRRDDLDRHKRSKHKPPVKRFQCLFPGCTFGFDNDASGVVRPKGNAGRRGTLQAVDERRASFVHIRRDKVLQHCKKDQGLNDHEDRKKYIGEIFREDWRRCLNEKRREHIK